MRRIHHTRRGAILPLVALTLIALFAMVALAVDLGLVALARTQCQNAADIAAMSAVRQLNGDTDNNNNYDAAEPTARAAAASNNVIREAVKPENVTVKVGYYAYNSTSQKFEAHFTDTKPAGESWSAVQVDVTADRSTFFARVFNVSGFAAGATATAVHRPRDIAIILDFSSSMRYSSEMGWPSSGDYSGSLNPDTVFPRFGHWSSLASVMHRTTASVDSDGDVHSPNNLTTETDNGLPVVKDFLYRNSSGVLQNAFHRVNATYDAMTWACPAPSDWDVQSSNTQTYVGDLWPRRGQNQDNTYAATVQELLSNNNNSRPNNHAKSTTNGPGGERFDPVNHNAPTANEGYGPNFAGYVMGPGYYGKSFFVWPPDPRWHPTSTALQKDWRKKFFCNAGTTTPLGGNSTSGTADNRVDNTRLWDSTGLWRAASSTSYSINYTAIVNWITTGPQVLPPNLRSGRVLYYSSIPTTIPQTGGTLDQVFWREYINYVLSNGDTNYQQRTLTGRNETAWGAMKITPKSSLSTDSSTRPYMHYNDNPIRPRLQFWFGPLSMLSFLGRNNGLSRNWLPGTCHEAQCWQLKAAIQSALGDIQKNHPNDWASLIYFSSLQAYTTPRVALGRDYAKMKNALFYPFSLLDSLSDASSEIRPYDSSFSDQTGGDVPNANGSTSPECGFKVAYNQLSSATGYNGRQGAAKMVIFETDGVPNTACNGTISNGVYTNLTVGSNVGNLNATVVSRALDTVSQICALSTASPPGYSTQKLPARVHAIGFGDIFNSTSTYQDEALDFLLQIQKRGNTSSSAATSIESYKVITGDYNTRISNLRLALERIMQSGIQVSLIR